VATIFAQVRRDAVGTGFDCKESGLDGVGMAPAARVANGRDVIDIDAKADGGHCGHVSYSLGRPRYAFTRSALATTSLARNCAMMEERCLMS